MQQRKLFEGLSVLCVLHGLEITRVHTLRLFLPSLRLLKVHLWSGAVSSVMAREKVLK